MKKNWYKVFILAAVIMTAGCNTEKSVPQGENATETEERDSSGFFSTGEEGILGFLSAEEDEEVVSIVVEYAEEEENPKLAEFLASYYQIPEEHQARTRYYYNHIDLNEDGVDELFCIIIKDYERQNESGSALILQEKDGFSVLEDFGEIVTPVLVSDAVTNGWHDVIFQVDGKGLETRYQVCHYEADRGYQTENNEWVDEPVQVSGTRILSNNLIDDMDQGRFLTLAPRQTEDKK